MRKVKLNKKQILGVFLLLGCFVITDAVHESRKPTYQGKSVTYWLEHLNNHHFYAKPDFVNQEALTALREMGKEAVPYMVSLLKEKPLFAGTLFHKWHSRIWFKTKPAAIQALLPSPNEHASDQRALVINVLGDLGSDAQSALPFFIQELNQPNPLNILTTGDTLEALAKITPGSGYETEIINALKKAKLFPFGWYQKNQDIDECIQTIQSSLRTAAL